MSRQQETTVVHEPDFSYSGVYTYADYLKWTIEERLELIKGKIFRMSPAPASTHQRLSQYLNAALYNFLSGKTCEVFAAPFDVRLITKSKRCSDKQHTPGFLFEPRGIVCGATQRRNLVGCI